MERWREPTVIRLKSADEKSEEKPAGDLASEVSVADDSEAQTEIVPHYDDEIAWRVEVFRQQIPEHGPLPFLVAREAVEPQAGCCLSCSDPLSSGDAYRCAACSRAANVAVETAMFISKSGTENGGRVD